MPSPSAPAPLPRGAPPLVHVPADGVEFLFDWGAVLPGTDRVELAPVTVDVQADRVSDFGGYPMGELGTQLNDGQLIVNVPGGRLIRALNLTGLKSENIALRSEQQLNDAG